MRTIIQDSTQNICITFVQLLHKCFASTGMGNVDVIETVSGKHLFTANVLTINPIDPI